MQSAAVRRYEYEDTEGSVTQSAEQSEIIIPAGPKKVVVEQSFSLSDPSQNEQGPAIPPNYEYYRRFKKRPFMRVLVSDVMRHWYFYFLCTALCGLCIFKVYQVQQTRLLTAELNELSVNNDDLSNEWLGLLAKKQALEKQSVIREAAVTKLNMVQPRTEAEIVIRLDR